MAVITGVMIGVLKEEHADHIVLSDGTRLAVANGLGLTRIAPGTRVTIIYNRDREGEMVVQTMTAG